MTHHDCAIHAPLRDVDALELPHPPHTPLPAGPACIDIGGLHV